MQISFVGVSEKSVSLLNDLVLLLILSYCLFCPQATGNEEEDELTKKKAV